MYRMFRHESKTFSKILHTLFHFFAFVLVVFGFVAIVMHKNIRDPPLPHFFSAHSWFGITIIVLFILQVSPSICGFMYNVEIVIVFNRLHQLFISENIDDCTRVVSTAAQRIGIVNVRIGVCTGTRRSMDA
jgi:hypothetical protein